MLIPLVPTAEDHFAGMRLMLLPARVVHQSDVLVDVKLEQRAKFAAGLRDDEIVEGVVLRDDHVLFDVHQLVHGGHAQLIELRPQDVETFLQKLLDCVALSHRLGATMSGSVPVAKDNLEEKRKIESDGATNQSINATNQSI